MLAFQRATVLLPVFLPLIVLQIQIIAFRIGPGRQCFVPFGMVQKNEFLNLTTFLYTNNLKDFGTVQGSNTIMVLTITLEAENNVNGCFRDLAQYLI